MASLGRPAAYFTRFRRSSSTAASRRPSATMAAEALAWYALRPRMIIEIGTFSFARDVECFKPGGGRRFACTARKLDGGGCLEGPATGTSIGRTDYFTFFQTTSSL